MAQTSLACLNNLFLQSAFTTVRFINHTGITFLKKVKQKSNKTNGWQLLFAAHATLSLSQQFHPPASQGVLFIHPH
jgi:hypothetical protein